MHKTQLINDQNNVENHSNCKVYCIDHDKNVFSSNEFHSFNVCQLVQVH